MLSPRATLFLQSLERRPALPTRIVRAALAERLVEVPEVWLSFHETFAGYVEPLGRDAPAVWGLMHETSEWQEPRAPMLIDLANGDVLIACADAHPSYDFCLDRHGEFTGSGSGGPCTNFEVRVERMALVAEASARLQLVSPLAETAVDDLLEEIRRHPVDVASDRYQRAFASDQGLLLESEHGRSLWVTHELATKLRASRGT